MRLPCSIAGLLACIACATVPAVPPVNPTAELAEAKALFERNIKAIQDKDRDAYLASYRSDAGLVRAGPDGVKLGFEELATTTPTVAEAWPTSLEAFDLTVHYLAPGIVYGSYRYRVTIAGETTEGWSERVFIKGADGWRITVTTAYPSAK